MCSKMLMVGDIYRDITIFFIRRHPASFASVHHQDRGIDNNHSFVPLDSSPLLFSNITSTSKYLTRMRSSNNVVVASILAAAVQSALAFQPTSPLSSTKTALSMVAVDPTTVTNKEYEDICGVSFDDDALEKRLEATNYLYPKHVEVIEDIAPIAGAMVDDVVSSYGLFELSVSSL